MKNLFSFFVAVCLSASTTSAQFFRWHVPVDSVDSAGYHRILLQPEVSGKLHAGYPDIRLYEGDDEEVPYLVVQDKIIRGSYRFEEYPIIEKHDRPHDSWITVENPLHGNEMMDHLCLEVNKTDANRKMTLTGSYDNKTWFALKDEFYTTYYESYSSGTTSTTNLVRFDFPRSNYRYFRFHFDNWSEWWKNYQAPVFVVRAGILKETNPASIEDQRMELPGVTFTQTNHDNWSSVDIVFADSQYVDYIRFDLTSTNAPGTFHRGAQLFEVRDSMHACLAAAKREYSSSTILSHKGLNEFAMNGRKVKHLCLHITNEDDQPLRVKAIHAIQVKRYLLAYLEPDKGYYVLYGSDSLSFPKYDLRYLEDSLVMHETPVTGTGERTRLPDLPPKLMEPGINSLFRNNAMIWSAMFLVVLVLAWMSVKMLREMKNKSDKPQSP